MGADGAPEAESRVMGLKTGPWSLASRPRGPSCPADTRVDRRVTALLEPAGPRGSGWGPRGALPPSFCLASHDSVFPDVPSFMVYRFRTEKPEILLSTLWGHRLLNLKLFLTMSVIRKHFNGSKGE